MLLLCFLFPFPLKTPLNMLLPLQSPHVSFSSSPQPSQGKSGAKGIQDPNYFLQENTLVWIWLS